jgi:uncharacterized membrane protein YadS
VTCAADTRLGMTTQSIQCVQRRGSSLLVVIMMVLHSTLVFKIVLVNLPTLPIDERLAILNAAWPWDDFISE